MDRITPCLWFDTEAEEAATFYTSVIVPRVMYELIADPDPERAQRAVAAMLQMTKLDVAELERAADATPAS